MTDRPSIPTATIPFAPRPRQPSVIEESEEISQKLEQQLAKKPRELTFIESVAFRVNDLRYRDLQSMCAAITGDDKSKELADHMAVWAEKVVDTCRKELA